MKLGNTAVCMYKNVYAEVKSIYSLLCSISINGSSLNTLQASPIEDQLIASLAFPVHSHTVLKHMDVLVLYSTTEK